MKKNWVSPIMMIDEFCADEYVSACGTTKGVYFKCDGGISGILTYYTGSNGDGILESGENTGKKTAYPYGGCYYYNMQDKIEDVSNAKLYDGIYTPYGHTMDSEAPVIVWVEKTNATHATRVLDRADWEPLKS